MEEEAEKRGPVEKGKKGWPINPFGVIALLIISLLAIFLIGKPLISRNQSVLNVNHEKEIGKITSPSPGQVIKNNQVEIKLSLNDQNNIEKVQYWAHIYADNSWEMIGESNSAPYTFNWRIPSSYNNKAIAITSHIIKTDGEIIKDPGGWVEGLIILSSQQIN